MDVKYAMDTKIEDNARMYKLQKAQYDQEVNTAVSIQIRKIKIIVAINFIKTLSRIHIVFSVASLRVSEHT